MAITLKSNLVVVIMKSGWRRPCYKANELVGAEMKMGPEMRMRLGMKMGSKMKMKPVIFICI